MATVRCAARPDATSQGYRAQAHAGIDGEALQYSTSLTFQTRPARRIGLLTSDPSIAAVRLTTFGRHRRARSHISQI